MFADLARMVRLVALMLATMVVSGASAKWWKPNATIGGIPDFYARTCAVGDGVALIPKLDLLVLAYEHVGADWVQRQSLSAEDAGHYGSQVALDKNTALIARGDTSSSVDSVDVWVRTDTTWSVQQRLFLDSGKEIAILALFSLHLQNDVAFISATFKDDATTTDWRRWLGGGVIVYRRVMGNWSRAQTLRPYDDLVRSGLFGIDMAVSGTTLLVSSPVNDEVHVFTAENETADWIPQQVIRSPDTELAMSFNYSFGNTVALLGNAAVIIGGESKGYGEYLTWVYFYETTNWTTQLTLAPEESKYLPRPQSAALVEVDGATSAFITAPSDNHETGVVRVYQLNGASWSLVQVLGASSPGRDFGLCVDVRGTTAVVGGRDAPDRVGNVYFYELVDGSQPPTPMPTPRTPRPTPFPTTADDDDSTGGISMGGNSTGGNSMGGSSAGAIAGGVIGGICVCALLVTGVYYYRKQQVVAARRRAEILLFRKEERRQERLVEHQLKFPKRTEEAEKQRREKEAEEQRKKEEAEKRRREKEAEEQRAKEAEAHAEPAARKQSPREKTPRSAAAADTKPEVAAEPATRKQSPRKQSPRKKRTPRGAHAAAAGSTAGTAAAVGVASAVAAAVAGVDDPLDTLSSVGRMRAGVAAAMAVLRPLAECSSATKALFSVLDKALDTQQKWVANKAKCAQLHTRLFAVKMTLGSLAAHVAEKEQHAQAVCNAAEKLRGEASAGEIDDAAFEQRSGVSSSDVQQLVAFHSHAAHTKGALDMLASAVERCEAVMTRWTEKKKLLGSCWRALRSATYAQEFDLAEQELKSAMELMSTEYTVRTYLKVSNLEEQLQTGAWMQQMSAADAQDKGVLASEITKAVGDSKEQLEAALREQGAGTAEEMRSLLERHGVELSGVLARIESKVDDIHVDVKHLLALMQKREKYQRGDTAVATELDWSEFELDGDGVVLGKGAQSVVIGANFAGMAVAVKKYKEADASDLQREVRVLGKLRHPNLVTIFGTTQSPAGERCLVMELAPMSLEDKLYPKGEGAAAVPPVSERLEWLRQAAVGLHFLTMRRVIHRDVKPDNVLIDEHSVAKICDFGVSKISTGEVGKETKMTAVMGTYEYMAPEALSEQGGITYKVDVYAFGVMLWESFALQAPYSDIQPKLMIPAAVLRDGQRPAPALAGEELAGVQALAERCWAHDASDRPDFTAVVGTMKALREEASAGGNRERQQRHEVAEALLDAIPTSPRP